MRFCTPTTTFARAKSIPNRQACRCIPNRRIHADCSTNAISLAIRCLRWAWRFKECLFDTELKAAQDYDIFLRMVVEYGEPWKVEEATQILHINHGEMQITSSPKKFSGYFHFYRKHKDKFDRASKKYQLFTLYQIRNKRMTWRTLLTLLSVRNGKRLADGIRGR